MRAESLTTVSSIVAEPSPLAADSRDRHFRTDHLMADLKGRSVRGGAITLGAQACKFVLQVGSTAVLARLLTPQDYGLIAMVAVFTGFVGLFKDLGLSMATIQRAEITHAQVSTLFWINVAVSVLLAGIGMALAPAIAWFYNEPRLVGITIALSATFIFGGLAAQHTALLRRRMKFHLLAAAHLTALLISIGVAILLARRGAAHWALVAMIATEAVATTSLTWLFSGWRPGLPRRNSDTWSMLAFGSQLTATNFLNFFARNADNFLIGRWLGAAQLGLYTKAYGLMMLPISQIKGPLTGVVVPAMSRLVNDPTKYSQYYLRVVRLMCWATTPLVAVLAALSDEVVLLVLGERWTAAAFTFKILAIAAVFQGLYSSLGWLYVSQGATKRLFRWACIFVPALVVSFAIGLPFGINGVAAAYTLAFSLLLPWTVWNACHGTPVAVSALYRTLLAPVGVGAGLYGAIILSKRVVAPSSLFLELAVATASGILAFAVLTLLKPVRNDVREVFATLRHLKPVRRNTEIGPPEDDPVNERV